MPGDRALIDTSVAVDIGRIDLARLPAELAISVLTLAELATGPHAARDPLTRARRQRHLQQIEAEIEALPFDSECSRAYGLVYAAVMGIGRKARGPRTLDLMIAATAIAHDLPLLTLNANDLRGIEDLVEIIDLRT